MPLLGLGTWQARGRPAVGAVHRALELGYRHIDTATVSAGTSSTGSSRSRSRPTPGGSPRTPASSTSSSHRRRSSSSTPSADRGASDDVVVQETRRRVAGMSSAAREETVTWIADGSRTQAIRSSASSRSSSYWRARACGARAVASEEIECVAGRVQRVGVGRLGVHLREEPLVALVADRAGHDQRRAAAADRVDLVGEVARAARAPRGAGLDRGRGSGRAVGRARRDEGRPGSGSASDRREAAAAGPAVSRAFDGVGREEALR